MNTEKQCVPENIKTDVQVYNILSHVSWLAAYKVDNAQIKWSVTVVGSANQSETRDWPTSANLYYALFLLL